MYFYFLKTDDGQFEFLWTSHPADTPQTMKQQLEPKEYICKRNSNSQYYIDDIRDGVKIGTYKQIDANTFERNKLEYDSFTRTMVKKTIVFDPKGGLKVIDSTNLSYVHLTSLAEVEQLIANMPSSANKFQSVPYLSNTDVDIIVPGSSIIAAFSDPSKIISLFKIINKLSSEGKQPDEIIEQLDEYIGKSSRSSLVSNRLYESSLAKEKTMGKYVFTPTAYIGEKVKNIFSYTIGFHWFTRLSSGWAKHGKLIQPPALVFVGGKKLLTIVQGVSYRVNAFNFWAVGLDIVARNLGKIIGWSLASFYSVPAYLAIKLGYGIKQYFIKRKLLSEIRNTDKAQLAFDWLQGAYSEVTLWSTENYQQKRAHNAYMSNLIAKHVNVFDFLEGAFANINRISSFAFDGEFSAYSEKKTRMEDYIKARQSLIQTQAQASYCEWEMLLELESCLDDLINPESIYTIGKRLLDEGKPHLAIHFLSQVRPDNDDYKEAMLDCCCYLMSEGQLDSAKYYAKRAGDAELLATLDKNPKDMFSFPKTPPAKGNDKGKEKVLDSDNKSSNYSYSQLADRYGLCKRVKATNPGIDETSKIEITPSI